MMQMNRILATVCEMIHGQLICDHIVTVRELSRCARLPESLSQSSLAISKFNFQLSTFNLYLTTHKTHNYICSSI